MCFQFKKGIRAIQKPWFVTVYKELCPWQALRDEEFFVAISAKIKGICI